MTIMMILLLAAAGFLSGAVNAIAGGGTFLTFGVMTLAGIPPISANATSSIVQFPGYVTSPIARRSCIGGGALPCWASCRLREGSSVR